MKENLDTEIVIDKKTNRIINTNIISLMIAQLISLLGSSIYSFAMGLYVLSQTGSGFNFAFTIIVGVLPGIVFGPIAGVMADRFDKKKIIIWTDLISAIILGIIWILFEKNGFHLSYIYISNLLLATCNAFAETPVQVSLPKLVDDKRLTKINSLCQAIQSISSIAGPSIGGMLFAIFDIKMFLAFNGISFLIATFFDNILNLHVNDNINGRNSKDTVIRKKNSEENNGSFFNDIKEGFVYIKTQKWLIILGSFTAFLNMFCMIGLTIAVPVIAFNIWKLSSSQMGVLEAVFPFGTLIGSLIMYNLSELKSNYKRIMYCITFTSITMLAIGFLSCDKLALFSKNVNYICIIILLLIFALCSVSYNIPFFVTIQRKVPEEILGRVRSVILTFVNALSPIGALIGGWLVDTVQPWLLPMTCGFIMIILTFLMWRVKSLKEI